MITLFLLLLVFSKCFIFGVFLVPFSYMEPALQAGDRVAINRLAFGFKNLWQEKLFISWSSPRRGDIVLMATPIINKLTLKRIIGLPDDEVAIHHNQVMVNGKVFLAKFQSWDERRVRVPPGKYYVLDDNSEEASDSRVFGFVDKEALLGQVKGVVFSTTGHGWLDFRHQRWFKPLINPLK